MYSLHYVLTVLLFASNSFQVWKTERLHNSNVVVPRRVIFIFILTGRETVELQVLLRVQYEAAEKSKNYLRN